MKKYDNLNEPKLLKNIRRDFIGDWYPHNDLPLLELIEKFNKAGIKVNIYNIPDYDFSLKLNKKNIPVIEINSNMLKVNQYYLLYFSLLYLIKLGWQPRQFLFYKKLKINSNILIENCKYKDVDNSRIHFLVRKLLISDNEKGFIEIHICHMKPNVFDLVEYVSAKYNVPENVALNRLIDFGLVINS